MATSGTGYRGGRPVVMSTRAVVCSGHYLATSIGLGILARGGNAFDAAAAVGFALNLTKPHQNGVGGEAPALVYLADKRKVHAVSGNGSAPAAATIALMRDEYGLELIPGDGLLPAVVPAAVGTWLYLLERFGTMRVEEVLAPSIRIAADGLPVYDALHNMLRDNRERILAEWPTTAEIWLPGGNAPEVGSLVKQPAWARTFKRLIRASRKYKNRKRSVRAAYDEFYRGYVAKRIERFCKANEVMDASGKAHRGLLRADDLAAWTPELDSPVSTLYKGIRVHKCPSWTQGPVLCQSLNLLEGYDLARMGHNSADYIHTVVECMKLAYADREMYYGDTAFVKTPLSRLLSKKYAAARRKLVSGKHASLTMRPGGFKPFTVKSVTGVNALFAAKAHVGDTTKLEVIDSAGNMVSVTPSGGWLQASPVIPELGFPLGTRGQMFSLVEGHPNALAPGKRPRTTLTPSLATLGGRPWLSFGSPGGDAQDQWALQFLVNFVEFGMSLQEAVEAPTFWSTHWPSSFYPREAFAGQLHVERRISAKVRRELKGRGHKIKVEDPWRGGNTLAVMIDAKTGVRSGAASPRLDPATAGGL